MTDMTSRLLTFCNSFSCYDLKEICLSCVKKMFCDIGRNTAQRGMIYWYVERSSLNNQYVLQFLYVFFLVQSGVKEINSSGSKLMKDIDIYLEKAAKFMVRVHKEASDNN